MIILGRGPGMVQFHLNTEDKGNEELMVTNILRECECTKEKIIQESNYKDSDASICGIITENCELEGLKYLTGFVVKK